MNPQRFLPLALVVALSLTGCGGGQFQPVSGQVVYSDGAPVTGLEGGTVVFQTTGADGQAISASGAIDAQGKFTLGTNTVNDGAAVGAYQVLITPPPATGDVPPPAVIHRKHEAFETSGIEVEVKQGKNDVKITVEPAK